MDERRRGRRAPALAHPPIRTRFERDLLGELAVPADALYGIQTARAIGNLSFSGRTLGHCPAYLRALAIVKKAAARANREAHVIDARGSRAIERACDALIRGEHRDEFPVDVLGGGGEIAVNMNVNEVIANLANETLGASRGTYALVHPKDHVNASQSTSDVCQTAARIALLQTWIDLEAALDSCVAALRAKAHEFASVMTLARTCLRDAEVTSLGEYFGGQAAAVARRGRELSHSADRLRQINLGGTAIGSGSGAPAAYRRRVIRQVRELSGLPLVLRSNLYDAAQNIDDLGDVAAHLALLAEVFIKLASDLRLLSSGPNGGFGEIVLPAAQEGSSFFPGKINPVIPETMLQCCFQVLGCERTVRVAVERGELNLNVFAGSAVVNLLDGLEMMHRAMTLFTERCIKGITANEDRCGALAGGVG